MSMSGYLQELTNMNSTEFEIWSDKLSTAIAHGVRYTVISSACSTFALTLLLNLTPVNYTAFDCIKPLVYTVLFWVITLPILGLYVQHKSTQVKG